MYEDTKKFQAALKDLTMIARDHQLLQLPKYQSSASLAAAANKIQDGTIKIEDMDKESGMESARVRPGNQTSMSFRTSPTVQKNKIRFTKVKGN